MTEEADFCFTNEITPCFLFASHVVLALQVSANFLSLPPVPAGASRRLQTPLRQYRRTHISNNDLMISFTGWRGGGEVVRLDGTSGAGVARSDAVVLVGGAEGKGEGEKPGG